MIFLPHPAWPTLVLAGVLLIDALASIWPPRFIRDCLEGVGFPRDWWWTLIVIKLTATLGLVVGVWVPGIAFAANVGVIAYFASAAAAHLRARFTGASFWLNCLGMLALSASVLAISYL